MQFLKRLFHFYIFSNIHIAFAAFCLVKITLLKYGNQENISSLFVFFSTIVAYNLIRFYRINDIVNWFSDWMKSRKALLSWLIFISVIFLFILTLQLKFKAILWLIPFIICTLFYVIPIPFIREPFRKIAGIKLFLIGISFAGITVIFPLIQNDILIGYNEWIMFIQRFLFIVLITIPFDIRDMNYDHKSLKTLPQTIGVKNSKIIGVLLGILFVMLEFFKEPVDTKQVITILIISIISSLFLINSKEIQSKYFSAFWVESLPIFWLIVIILGLNM